MPRSKHFSKLKMSRLLPEVLAVRRGTECNRKIVLELHIPPDIVHFDGHFPGLAILPGVIQIDWALHFAHEHLPLRGEFVAMDNIKFQAQILPDTRLDLSLDWDAIKGRLEFTFATSQRKYSTGRIVFGGHT
jgi:3-hydroxymyristoyl/3-hydroxydecanoyl-(acyl carrier protein) dehydratase